MRKTLVCLVLLSIVATLTLGCATRRCIEEYSTMPTDQVIRGDGQLLQQLVEKRRAAAEALQNMSEGNSERSDLVFSIQAWEMAISLVVQLQNLARQEEHASQLEAQRELTTNIRCEARSWVTDEDHLVAAGDGQAMLSYSRELETHFGEQGRPTDSQLTAICEGREIYMGPVEEEVDVPETEEGAGPESTGEETDEEPEPEEEANTAVDDLLGEEE